MKISKKIIEILYNTVIILIVSIYNLIPGVSLDSRPHNIIFLGLFIATSIQIKLSYTPILIILWGVNYFFVNFEDFALVSLYFLMTFVFRLWSFRIFHKDLILAAGRGFVSDFGYGKVQLGWIDILYTAVVFITVYIYLR